MRILFVTDLHGCVWKYRRLFKIARAFQADMVVNGGDMLPGRVELLLQDAFITRDLKEHFDQFEKAGIFYLCYPGNDDPMIFDALFDKTCRQYEYIFNMAQRKATINDIDFIGMNWVVDYPFRIKDRCRMDTRAYTFQPQFGTGLLSTSSGWEEIDDWHAYAKRLPTIEDELSELPQPRHRERSVYIIHMPPAYIGLDVCGNGERVGSRALYNFLRRRQPKLSLHGHIHESPEMSGIWKAQLGNTICIQPGQMKGLTYVAIDAHAMKIERHTE